MTQPLHSISPMPWSYDTDEMQILDATGMPLGGLARAKDDWIAVHSVNTLPEVVKALMGAVQMLEATEYQYGEEDPAGEVQWHQDIEKFRAALAKAKP